MDMQVIHVILRNILLYMLFEDKSLFRLFTNQYWWASWGFLGGSDSKESACSAGDLDLIPGSGEIFFSPGEKNSNPLQYSYLENPMDKGTWWAIAHGVAKSQTRLSE